MDPERTEVTWSYEALDFFEVPYEATRGDTHLRIESDTAVLTINGGRPSEEEERVLLDWVNSVLQIRALQTGKQYTLHPDPNVVEYRDGKRHIFMRLGLGVVAVMGGSADFVRTDSSGNVVADTRAERIAAQRSELDDLATKAKKNVALRKMLDSLAIALREPDSEFVRLYEIRDALQSHYGTDAKARQALNFSNAEWLFGFLTNSPEIVEGRHRGRHFGELRRASAEERAPSRSWSRLGSGTATSEESVCSSAQCVIA